MTEQQIKKYLSNIGKGCFVQHYEIFADESISNDDKIQILLKAHGYAEKSCAARIKKAQFIIKDGFGNKALTMIIKSELSDEIKQKAKDLLNRN